MVKIVIADDHIVLREGLKSLLNSVEGWQVVGEATDGFEVLPLVKSQEPHIVIMDLSMPNLGGLEAITRLQREDFKPSVLVLSAKDDHVSVGEAMRAGANGFIPKSSASDELFFAIRSLIKGQTYLSPAIAEGALQSSVDGSTPITNLSSREREVLKLLCEGHPNRAVAKMLHISPRTIDSHRANIMKKLKADSNAELVQIAVKYGLVE